MYFRLLYDERSGVMSYLPAALWESVVNDMFKRHAQTLLFTGHATRSRAVSNVLEQRRWRPWFGGATRGQFLARVSALPSPATNPPPA
jgi:sulfur dioxygenase